MNFIKNVLATVVGIFLFFVLSFFILIGIAAVVGGGEKEIKVEDQSVIELDLSEIVFDYSGKYKDESPLQALLKAEGKVGFIDVLNAIKLAKTDSKIKGISIINNESFLGLAQSKELRDQLIDFKKSGKFIYSYANFFTQKEYYINSVADQVYINPVGELEFKGLSSELLFFKDFQDKTGLKFEVIRHGKYKSAVEPFLNQEMSPENREQMTSLLNSVWNTIVTDISASRKISVAKLNEIANNLEARTPELALQQKLVDKIAYEDEYHSALKTKLKVAQNEEYNKISIADYTNKNNINVDDLTKDDVIAVIYAQGEINGGEGDVDFIGEGSINRSLKEAREDENIKAIVLRVDSPGGSALTSELIWREIELTKKSKPVVVSMGNLAASGGYYISCGANAIFAEPTTITGSIGVFGMLPNFSQLANKMGINAEQVNTHKNASGYSPFEPITDEYKSIALEGVERTYKTFVNRVATGRKMKFENVDAIGQGRVWTGSDALKIGLVDKLGNLDAAIKYAATLGKSKEYRVETYPEYEKNFNEILEHLANAKIYQSKEAYLKEEVGEENYILIDKIRKMKKRKGIQAILPYEINF